MKSHYYCKKCDIYFYEEDKFPNINRIHFECGSRAKLLKYFPELEKKEEE